MTQKAKNKSDNNQRFKLQMLTVVEDHLPVFYLSIPSQEITIELLRNAMRQHNDCPGFLIDGFPRENQQGLQFEQEVSLF